MLERPELIRQRDDVEARAEPQHRDGRIEIDAGGERERDRAPEREESLHSDLQT